jgi:hypothetical protein
MLLYIDTLTLMQLTDCISQAPLVTTVTLQYLTLSRKWQQILWIKGGNTNIPDKMTILHKIPLLGIIQI